MSEVNFERMLEICERFVDTNPIDFYQLFEIDKNMNLMEINKDIKNKRLRVLFHPDQMSIIPDKYKATFQKISDSIPELVDVFSSKENRKKYDQSLENLSEVNNDKNLDNGSVITDQEKKDLEHAVIVTATKYGWKHLVAAIGEFINNNNVNGFTRDGNVRNIIDALGRDKIREIVFASSYADISNDFRINVEQMIANYISELFKTNPILVQQTVALKNAIDQTMYKYGSGQVCSALNKYVDTNNANGITSTGEARDGLRKFVRPQDVQDILLFMNNQNRFNDAASYYVNAKGQNLDYQFGLYVSNLQRNAYQTSGQQY